MLLYTYAMLIDKVNRDNDLLQETFVDPTELLGYLNEGIEAAETAVHTLGVEDTYFLSTDFLNLRSGVATYPFPTDIYANKIRKIFYSNPTSTLVTTGTWIAGVSVLTVGAGLAISQGQTVFGTGLPQTTKVISYSGVTVTISTTTTVLGTGATLTFVNPAPVYGARRYEVRKMRALADTLGWYPGDDYQFLIINSPMAAGGNQIQLYPTPAETGPLVQFWYIREIRRLTSSLVDANNVSELPEVNNFLFQYVRWKVAKKTRIVELIAQEAADLKVEYANMQETLREMVPDENNRVQMDLSAYFNQEMDLKY